jgi:hypothetical protein
MEAPMKISELAYDIETAQRIAGIGDNNPPVKTPFEAVRERIDDLYIEAGNFLDGEPITTAEMDAAVKKLEDDLKAAIKAADAARSEEYKPLNDAKTEIQQRYDPIIGGSKCDGGIGGAALAACKKAREPYLIEQLRIKEEAARIAREEADRIRLEALKAHQAADASNLAEKQAADALLKQAEDATKAANRAQKASETKTGLRTTFSAEIVDLQALARHIWTVDQDGLRALLQEWADRTVSSFGQNAAGLNIPGCIVHSKQEAR